MKDEFFLGLIGELGERAHDVHPPERILRRYLRRRLPDEGRLSAEVDRLLSPKRAERWTLTAVSLHVATCRECRARLAELRAAGSRRRSPIPRLRGWTLKRRLAYYIPLATIAAGLIMLLVNLLLLNPHSPAQNCIFGGLVR